MAESQPQGEQKAAPAPQQSESPGKAPIEPAEQTGASSAPSVETLQEELRGLKDRYLRLAADFDNFRKRTAQETEVRAAARKEVIILELLPVLDSLDRALAGDGTVSGEQLHVGVEMISQQLLHVLSQHGVQPDDCLGQAFNPHRHEAIGVGHDVGHPSQAVLRVCRRGWIKGKEVLRPAQMIVNDLSRGEERSTGCERSSDHDESVKTESGKAQDSGAVQPQPRGSVSGDAV